MEPTDAQLAALPEPFVTAHAVHGSWLFGRVVKRAVNRWESVYAWEGGPLALATPDQWESTRRLAEQGVLFSENERPVKLRTYGGPSGEVVVWCRVETDDAGTRILDWPEDQPVAEGYVR